MGADAAELLVESVRVLAQEPHDLHVQTAMFPQKCEELLERNKDCRRLVACFRGDPIVPLESLEISEQAGIILLF